MSKHTMTIWGAGFVGATAYEVFKHSTEFFVRVFNPYKETSKLFLEDKEAKFVDKVTALDSDLHMICVPTPMIHETGECDISIVDSVIKDIIEHHVAFPTYREIVIKSTVPVGTTEHYSTSYQFRSDSRIQFMFNPEFLTEANALNDFEDAKYQIVGIDVGYDNSQKRENVGIGSFLWLLYNSSPFTFKVEFKWLQPDEAEMVKLMRNCYLATRLSFFNEMKQFTDACGINFEKVTQHAGLDPRIGNHYNKVPGPDGRRGWSLSCLPKDINNVIYSMKDRWVKPTVLEAVWQKNLEVRPERDWEDMAKAVVSAESKKNNGE